MEAHAELRVVEHEHLGKLRGEVHVAQRARLAPREEQLSREREAARARGSRRSRRRGRAVRETPLAQIVRAASRTRTKQNQVSTTNRSGPIKQQVTTSPLQLLWQRYWGSPDIAKGCQVVCSLRVEEHEWRLEGPRFLARLARLELRLLALCPSRHRDKKGPVVGQKWAHKAREFDCTLHSIPHQFVMQA